MKFGNPLYVRQLSPLPACALITADVAVDCANIPAKGTDATVYLANFDEVTLTGLDTATNIVDAITMASTKTFFSYGGLKTSTKPKATMRKLAFTNVYDHEISAAAFKIDAATFTQFQKLTNGKVVAIVINNATGTAGETKYKIYGGQSGLFMENLVYDPYNADGAQITFTLKSDPDAPEPRLPLAFFDTNLSTTDTAFAALL